MMKIGLFAGGLKLKKTKLKPYVHKVKGAKNYALRVKRVGACKFGNFAEDDGCR